MFSKSHIIDEIRRTTGANNNRPLGQRQFERETGIKRSDWRGKFWARWGDALTDAGFPPNVPPARINEDTILKSLMNLTLKLGRFPTRDEIKLEKNINADFPSITIITKRIGLKKTQLEKLLEFSIKSNCSKAEKIFAIELSQLPTKISDSQANINNETSQIHGFVYMLKSGKHYKIGRTKSIGRREYELSIQLPEKPKEIHYIKTDDTIGIENYWHERFKNRRKNGEWFELSKEDVAAFKRRKFM